MNAFNRTDENKQKQHSPGEQAQVDMLELFDKASIGNEFARSETPKGKTREMEMRRDTLNREHWHSTTGQHKKQAEILPPADPVPARFSRVRTFEEKTMGIRGFVFWAVFVLITLGGGIMYGFIFHRVNQWF